MRKLLLIVSNGAAGVAERRMRAALPATSAPCDPSILARMGVPVPGSMHATSFFQP